ncbi:MAG: glycosyl transferase [Acidobacteria bacterium]|nr:glycosyl transferase [Acidobacteriota bacterium]
MKRIVFVAPPFAGHLNPLLVLGVAARDAGYGVEVITGDRKLGVVRGAGLQARGLASIGADALESIANTSRPVRSNPALLLAQFRENLALMPAIQAELRELWRTERPDLVVADSVAPVAGFVAEELGIPWVTTIATPFAIENRQGVPAYCGGWRPGSSLRDAVGRFAVRSFKRAVAWHFRREFAVLGGGFPYREDGTERIYSPQAILGFGMTELEFERDWPACFSMIGPVVKCPEPVEPLAFPAGRKRVLISIGTHLLWAKRTLVEDVVRLAAPLRDVQFVVSLGGARGSVGRAAENVTVHRFVPYARDLGAFDAVVHHGGAGIVYAATLHGVPCVTVPHDYDQFDYAARIEHFGLGLRAGSVAGAGEALRTVLDWGRRRELEWMRNCAREYRPCEKFLEVVLRLVN